MSLSLNRRATSLSIPGIRQFSNQLVHYPNAVNLTIGQPDFPTPEKVKAAAINAINSNYTTYSHNAGILPLRQVVSQFFYEKYGFLYNPDDEIIVTNGASEAIDSILKTILEEGDEVILPAPIYSGYEPMIEYYGAKVIYLDTTDTQFQPSSERLSSLITAKTKAVLFNFPSNPTGATISLEQMDALANILEQHDLYILSDEIYSENTFNHEHKSFASYPALRDKLFLIHGLSKSHSMTGWRIGFLLGPDHLIAHVIKLHAYNTICASVPSQYAAIEALTTCRDVPNDMNKEYIIRRDYVYNKLVNMGMEVIRPNGAFYIFPSIKQYGLPSYEFATRLLQEGGVAAVPGSVFTPYGEGFLRITYAYSMDLLEEGLKRIELFTAQFK